MVPAILGVLFEFCDSRQGDGIHFRSGEVAMAIVSRVMFGLVNFAARKGISDADSPGLSETLRPVRAQRTGVRGETFAYWYLRRHGYVFVARNYKVPGMKGEIDLIGYDGEILAFVEVKTRACDDKSAGLPEDAVNAAKRNVIRNGAGVSEEHAELADDLSLRHHGDRIAPGRAAARAVAQRCFRRAALSNLQCHISLAAVPESLPRVVKLWFRLHPVCPSAQSSRLGAANRLARRGRT